jgi:uncharacterized protein (TIGR02246 family)
MSRFQTLLLILALLAAGLVLPQLYPAGAARSDDTKVDEKPKPRPGLRRAGTAREDEQAIRKATASFSAAFNKGDLDGLVALWCEDGEFFHESGRTYRGKPAIRAMLEKALPGFKGHKQSIKVESLRFVRPEVAVQEGSVTTVSPEGVSDTGKFLSLWVKQDGKWLLNQVRDLPAAEEAKAPAHSHLKQLAWMVGEWQDREGKGHLRMTCKWAPGQSFLVQEFVVQQADGKEFHVTQWIGYDPAHQHLRSWMFDSGGGYGGGVWTRQANTWVSQSEGVYPDGKLTTSSESLKFIDDKTAVWTSKAREVEEQPLPDLEITFIRKAKTP